MLRELDFQYFVVDMLMHHLGVVPDYGDLPLPALTRLTPHYLLLHIGGVLGLVGCRAI